MTSSCVMSVPQDHGTDSIGTMQPMQLEGGTDHGRNGMGQVAVTLNGRTYRLRCGDGEEERLMALSAHVRTRLESLTAEFGQAGDERLLLMAALLTADELFEARDRISALEKERDAAVAPSPATTNTARANGSPDKGAGNKSNTA